jgi:hypothetical protein
VSTVTWTTTRTIARTSSFELPERVRTRCGYQLFRVPDILRVNGRLYISKRLMDKTRRRIALHMQQRIDEMARSAFLGGAR